MLEFVLTSLNVSFFFIENINIPEWSRFTAFSLQDSSATTIRWSFEGSSYRPPAVHTRPFIRSRGKSPSVSLGYGC